MAKKNLEITHYFGEGMGDQALIYRWREYKLVQTPWKTTQQSVSTLHIFFDQTILPLEIYPADILTDVQNDTWVLIRVLFIVEKFEN